jgi:hypothetical protein
MILGSGKGAGRRVQAIFMLSNASTLRADARLARKSQSVKKGEARLPMVDTLWIGAEITDQ